MKWVFGLAAIAVMLSSEALAQQQQYRLSAVAQRAEWVPPEQPLQPVQPTAPPATHYTAQLNKAPEGRPAVVQPVPSMEAIAQAKAQQATQSASAPAMQDPDQPRFYLGAGGGMAMIDWGVASSTGSVEVDEDSFAYKVFAGYQFNRFLSLEGHYADLGEFSLSGRAGDSITFDDGTSGTLTSDINATMNAWSIGASALVSLPISDMFVPFGRIGVHRWVGKGGLSAATVSVKAEDDGFDLLYGGGVQANVTDHISLRGEFERYVIDDEDVDVFTGSLLLRF
jgi:OOP family OmpA-OmpF porin